MTQDIEGYVDFGDEGCSFCTKALAAWQKRHEIDRSVRLNALTNRINRSSPNSDYDCIVGVSGGIDSSWALVKAKELGFKPLAVHMDNTWNSELANNNIASLISKLDIDLVTKVIDARSFNLAFKSLMAAQFLDLEILYDNLLHAVVYKEARTRKIPIILSGFNLSTEMIEMPKSWSAENKFDSRIIESAIGPDYFNHTNLELFSNWAWMKDSWLRGIRWERFLDCLPDFDLKAATNELQVNFDFKPYPTKHYENTLTMFFQGYVLPRKYGIDKRRVHLSSLVLSGQMKRAEAFAVLEQDPLGSEQDIKELVSFVCDRLEISEIELQMYIADKSPVNAALASELPARIARRIRRFL